ncbi:MAG: OsmC family protein, partial [Bacteroidetes bacterium]|nr:OsmC family protein [Bacteroidota bacterium]
FTTHWKNAMTFETNIDQHTVKFDTFTEFGGNDLAASPKKVFLTTLAGCTGMDVVSILQKMKVDFSSFSITAKAEISEEHPKVFTEITLTYQFQSDIDNLDKIKKAIQLSQNKYCGISAMLKKVCPIYYSVEILS